MDRAEWEQLKGEANRLLKGQDRIEIYVKDTFKAVKAEANKRVNLPNRLAAPGPNSPSGRLHEDEDGKYR